MDMVLGPDGMLYVTSYYSNSVLRFHPRTGAYDGVAVSPGTGGLSRPFGLTFDKGGDLFVASQFTHSVLVFDRVTGALKQDFLNASDGGACRDADLPPCPIDETCSDPINGGSCESHIDYPGNLLFDFRYSHPYRSGKLFVGMVSDDSVHRYSRYGTGTTSTDTKYLGVFGDATFPASGLNGPRSMLIARDGGLYVAERSSSFVSKFDEEGTFLRTSPSLGSPHGLALAPNGELLVTTEVGSTVERLDPDTLEYLGNLVSPGAGGLSGATAVLTIPEYPVYASIRSSIVEVDTLTLEERVVSSGDLLQNARGIAVASDGTLIVANHDYHPSRTSGVLAIDPVTGTQEAIASLGLDIEPRGLVLEPSGNILIVGYDGTLYRVDRATGASSIIASGGFLVEGAEGLALSPNGVYAYVGGYRQIVQVATADGFQTQLSELPWSSSQIIFESPDQLVALSWNNIVRFDPATGDVHQLGELNPDWLDDSLSVGYDSMTLDDAGRVWIGESWFLAARIFPVDPTAGGHAAVVAQPLLPTWAPEFLVSGRPSCEGQCASPTCGDGVVDPGKDCDIPGPSTICDPDCSFVTCGDGTTNVAANEACDDGNASSGDGCSATCSIEWRRAFLSSRDARGDIGLDDADDICQQDARDGLLHGSFLAWLSTSNVDARDRLAGPDVEIRMRNGVKLADDLVDLTTPGSLDAPLTVNAFGTLNSGRTWTGTTPSGVHHGASCSDWTSTSGFGRSGDAIRTDAGWTDYLLDPCDSELRIYCFETFLTGCGNGFVDDGEQCDDAGESAACNANCTLKPGCGNTICDPGETAETCAADCGCTSFEELCGLQAPDGCFCDILCVSSGDCCPDACDECGRCPPTVCGNGEVEGDEECDDGNLDDNDCCSSSCSIEPPQTVCRQSAGPCDAAETCGESSSCPPDALLENGFACDDGDPCTSGTQCQSGVCSSGVNVCCGNGECGAGETPENCAADCGCASFEGLCGVQAPGGCYCDDLCVGANDCCPDACDECGQCPSQTIETEIISAVLPYARATEVNGDALTLGQLINLGPETATQCSRALPPGFPGTLTYQALDGSGLPTGEQNDPVDVGPSGIQGFVFTVTPSQTFAAQDIAVVFDCLNTDPAPSHVGVNTFLVSSSVTPPPDLLMVSVSTRVPDDKQVALPGHAGTQILGIISLNVGAAGTMTVMADTGEAALPLTTLLCRVTESLQCDQPPSPTVTVAMNTGPVETFSLFVTGQANVPKDLLTNRIYVRMKDQTGEVRGATAVAVYTED